MPSFNRELTIAQARDLIGRASFRISAQPTVGVEAEWITAGEPLSIDSMKRVIGSLPHESIVTFEPGGQLEVSSRPTDLATVLEASRVDHLVARQRLLDAGVSGDGIGLDPRQERERLLRAPRYAAMERYFDQFDDRGRTMMRRTAAVQVNISCGIQPTERWRLLNSWACVLAATFANSRTRDFKSGRMANWLALDPSRTAPLPTTPAARDVSADWIDAVIQARVMLVRHDENTAEPVLEDLSLERWLRNGSALGFPTSQDVEYHLSTMFPPVRARGWFEVRVVDAQPDPFTLVPLSVIAAVCEDSHAASEVMEATIGAAQRWNQAVSFGLDDAIVAEAAKNSFESALRAMRKRSLPTWALNEAETYFDRYTSQNRSPADDQSIKQSEAA